MGLIDQFHAKQRELDERARRTLADQGTQENGRPEQAAGQARSLDRSGQEPRSAAQDALGGSCEA